MTRADKSILIDQLKEKFVDSQYFYIADSSSLTVGQINKLRALCFENGIEVKVVKNTLAKKAMEPNESEKGFAPLYEALTGPTTIFFADVANAPARIMKEFRKSSDKPVLKAAYIDSDVFLGDDQLEVLASLKSKEELIGEITVSCEECNKCFEIKWRYHCRYFEDA